MIPLGWLGIFLVTNNHFLWKAMLSVIAVEKPFSEGSA